jgi:curved DNA-binding protein CbpA
MQDYYSILGVSPTVSQKEIKSAFRRLAKQNHPDKVDESCKKAAENKFKQIAEAYYVLNDPARRCEYDLSRKRIKPSEGKDSSSAYSDTLTFDIDEIIGYAKERLREIDRGTFIVRFIFGSGLGLLLGFFCSAGFSVNSNFVFVLFLLIPMLLSGLLSAMLGDKFWIWIGRSVRWIVWGRF